MKTEIKLLECIGSEEFSKELQEHIDEGWMPPAYHIAVDTTMDPTENITYSVILTKYNMKKI